MKDFDPKPFFGNAKTIKSTDRYTHFAVAASKLAVKDASLSLDDVDLSRLGVIVGSAFGGMDTFEKQTLNLDKGRKCAQVGSAQVGSAQVGSAQVGSLLSRLWSPF